MPEEYSKIFIVDGYAWGFRGDGVMPVPLPAYPQRLIRPTYAIAGTSMEFVRFLLDHELFDLKIQYVAEPQQLTGLANVDIVLMGTYPSRPDSSEIKKLVLDNRSLTVWPLYKWLEYMRELAMCELLQPITEMPFSLDQVSDLISLSPARRRYFLADGRIFDAYYVPADELRFVHEVEGDRLFS